MLVRPLCAGDWSALWAIASNREVWRHHPAHDRWREPVFRAFFADALAQGGALAVIYKADGAIVGSSRFQEYDPAGGGSVEIGWTFLARDRWGTGLNAELKLLMLAHALGSVERALFVVGEHNVISRRAMEKIGGRLSGKSLIVDRGGRPVRHLVYEIDRSAFAGGPLMMPASPEL